MKQAKKKIEQIQNKWQILEIINALKMDKSNNHQKK